MSEKVLFDSEDLELWKVNFHNYKNVLSLYAKKKEKSELVQLDLWYQELFKDSIVGRRKVHCITKNELVKLMKWKLMRGKFRPRLNELVKVNSEELVEKYSAESFAKLSNPKDAINALCKLKAVGAATASAILTVYCPEKFAFMADEAVVSVLNGKIDYTLKYYLNYLKEIVDKAEHLSHLDSRIWTPHDVELTLWTAKVSASLGIDLKSTEQEKDLNINLNGIKRKSEKLEDSDDVTPATKKKLT